MIGSVVVESGIYHQVQKQQTKSACKINKRKENTKLMLFSSGL